MNCIFCDIVEKKSGAEILYEDENVLSFLDIRPLNFGHTLVIPKKHYEDFHDVPAEQLAVVTSAAQKIAGAIKEKLETNGINIIVNNGKAAGQTIYHFHYHIIPRFDNDGFIFHPEFKHYDKDLMKEYGDRIRAALK